MNKLTTFFKVTVLIFTVSFLCSSVSSAAVYPINESLSGLEENPPNVSPGTGTLTGTYDDVTKTLSFTLTFSGLLGFTTASHYHAPAGVTTNAPVRINFGPLGFPIGVQNGVFAAAIVLTPQQEAWLLGDSMYVNVHSTVFPGGELRSQLHPDVPLPVELTSFVSFVNRNDVSLNWTTSSEINNAGFDIERKSSVSNDWQKVGNVSGHGTISTPSEYTFTERVNTGTYNYRLKQIDLNGNFEYYNLSNEVNVGIISSYSISQNYPNPFNPETKIDFNLPEDGFVSITLYDNSGREISSLVNESKNAGFYTVKFNASDLSSGIYFYTIKANGFSATKKMILNK